MSALFSLAVAKFPPSRVPALMEEMRKSKGEVDLHANVDAKTCYKEFIAAGEGIEGVLTAERELDIVLVSQDLDDAGYGIINYLLTAQRAFQCRQLPLNESQRELRKDAKDLLEDLFPKGNEIFRYTHLAEWSEVKIVLQRANQPENAQRVERLRIKIFFGRMKRCHEAMGRLLGIGGEAGAEENVFTRFQEALSQLISAIVLRYGRDIDEHRRMRELLVGPIQRHIGAYREEQRKRQNKSASK